MADLFLGQTCTEAYKFISAGTAHTFTFNFQPDKVVFNNLTKWTATAGGDAISVWFRDQTTAAHAFQQVVIDSAAAQSFNFKDASTNGFTVADTEGGQASSYASISAISQANPCVVTTSAAHGFQNDQIVRITDLGSSMPTARGMDQLNNKRFKIVIIDSTSFSLKDVITGVAINSTSYVAYVTGGSVTLETHVLSLNNPQVYPYAVTPYVPNGFAYDPIEYKLLVGTDVMQSDGDVFLVEVYKWGQIIDLGDLLT